MMKLTKEQAVRLNLWKQQLYHPPQQPAKKEDLLPLMKRLGLIQLDTLNVVTRTHNLVFSARLAGYDEAWFWELYAEQQAFEGYVHALSLLPMEEYEYFRPFFEGFKDRHPTLGEHDLDIYNRVCEEGPVTSRDLQRPDDEKKELATWEMSPVRRALDHLWRSGRIGVTRNPRFNKVYDRIEKVIPAEHLQTESDWGQTYRHCALHALSAMGAATERDVSDYYRLDRKMMLQKLQRLVQEGIVREVDVEGVPETSYASEEDLELLHSPELAEEPTHAVFLSPFDNLVWHRPRVLQLFGLDYRLESYVPEAKRQFGYFALPILLRGRIVGTIDLKADRKNSVLLVNKLVLVEKADRKEIKAVLEKIASFLQLKRIEGLPRFRG